MGFRTYRMAKISTKHPIVGTTVKTAIIIMVCISFQSANRIQGKIDSSEAIINYNPMGKNNVSIWFETENGKTTANPGE